MRSGGVANFVFATNFLFETFLPTCPPAGCGCGFRSSDDGERSSDGGDGCFRSSDGGVRATGGGLVSSSSTSFLRILKGGLKPPVVVGLAPEALDANPTTPTDIGDCGGVFGAVDDDVSSLFVLFPSLLFGLTGSVTTVLRAPSY